MISTQKFRIKEGRIRHPYNPWTIFKYLVEDAAEEYKWPQKIINRVWEHADSNKWIVRTDYDILAMAELTWTPPKRPSPSTEKKWVRQKKSTRIPTRKEFDPIKYVREQISQDEVPVHIAKEIFDRIDANQSLLKTTTINNYEILGWSRRQADLEKKLWKLPFSEKAEKNLRELFKRNPEAFKPGINLFELAGSLDTSPNVTQAQITVRLAKTSDEFLDDEKKKFFSQCWKSMPLEWRAEISQDINRWNRESEAIWTETVVTKGLVRECQFKATKDRERYKRELKIFLKAGLKSKH